MRLGVNVDHVATLRQARGGASPDPVEAALVCQRAGAHAVVMHLREDRRHIQDQDLFRAKRVLSVKLNMEMSIAPSVLSVALRLRPDQATLVPERRKERTTERGLDLVGEGRRMGTAIEKLKSRGVSVSLFLDPERRQIDAAKRLGADAVEIHTGAYAEAKAAREVARELRRIREAERQILALGLVAHAGHGLDYHNVRAITRFCHLDELNIGYSIISRAVWVGLDAAVRQMRRLVESR